MQVYPHGKPISELKPAGFLRAANAKFIDQNVNDVMRLDAGDLSGPYAVGIWGSRKVNSNSPTGAFEFVTILEGRVIVTQAGKATNSRLEIPFSTQGKGNGALEGA